MILALVTTAALGCASTPVVDEDDGPPVATPPPLPNRTEPAAADAEPDASMDSRERARIVAEVTAYYRDLTARDWDSFARHFWRGAVVSTIWDPGDGTERVDFISVPEYIAQIDLGPDSTLIFEQMLGTIEVQFDGTIAQVWAEHRVRFGEPGDVREWTDHDAFTLMKHVGMWKISALALSSR